MTTDVRSRSRMYLHLGMSVLAAGAFLAFAGEPSVGTQSSKPVTFTKDIAPIFQEKCQSCHRKDSMAPMSLVTYEETRPWARSIKERVIKRQMPPWHLDKSVGIQKFQNDMSLSDEQIAVIAKWVDSGSPQGDPKDMPPPKTWPADDTWQLAKVFNRPPDMIIKSDDYTMPAVSQDQWWKPVVDLNVKDELWVRAVEMRPGTTAGRKITHHALVHLIQDDPDAKADTGDDAAAQQGGVLMEWAVGKNYDIYRPNTGKLIRPGAKAWWDIHYHAVGEQVTDHVELGVWLYPKDEKPKYRTYLTGFQGTNAGAGSRLDIEPNSIGVSQGFHVLKEPAILGNFQPHMHLRGKAMLLEAILPDGTTQTISYVDHFNFNWMTNYIYTDDAAPVLPKGTIIHVTAWHDNTTANPFNPDPNQWVGWGDRTVDEMAHAWVNVTYISQEDYDKWAAAHKKPRSGGPRAALTAADPANN
ncbi:MAG TPA: cytochrome c [Bryobacteraceae bacterium]|nr:cytochrome c [Bryobacteraceae bacterium]